MAGADEVKNLMLNVDASVELARRNLRSLMGEVEKFQKNADQQLEKVDKDFNALGTGGAAAIGKLKSLMAGAFVGGGLLAAFKSVTDTAREIQNFSRIAGLGAEDFQSFAFAAKSVGFEADKVADILKDVNDKFGDFFQTGAGPLADFFEKIAPKVGVTAEQFRKLNSRDALQLYVESLEKANVSQADMTFYMEAIANDATALIPILKNSGQQLSAMEQEFKDLGLAIDDAMIVRLTDAQKSWDRGLTIMKNRATVFAGGVIELFERIGDTMDRNRANFILSSPASSDAATQWAQDILIAQSRAGLDRLSALSRQFAPGDYLADDDRWEPPKPDSGRARSAKAPERVYSPAERRMGYDVPAAEVPVSLDVEASLTDFSALDEALAGVRARTDELDISFADVFDADLQRRMQDIQEYGVRDLSAGLADVLVYGEDVGDVLENSFKRAAAAMLEAVIQAQVLGPLLDGIKKGGGEGGGLLGSIVSGIGAVFGGPRASGGPVQAGKMYMVGERGPEPFIPRLNGDIISNENMRRMMGGGGGGSPVTVNVDARGATDPAMVEAAAYRAVYAAAPALINASNASMQNRLTRRKLPGGWG